MRRTLLVTILTAAILAFTAAAPAAADPATVVPVDTPEGTYYVYTHGAGHAPSVDPDGGLCIFIPGFARCLPDASWPGTVQVWEETNGCPGLQTSARTCPSTGQSVGADDRL